MSEVRRCRRCKRKRMDDEPPEVRQYKTCAKCRIIERQKKKSRKPLAEETMIYGMRQFQQQNQNSNFSHDDLFMDDDMFSKKKENAMNNSNYLYQYSYLGAAKSGGDYDGSRLTGNATALNIPQTLTNNLLNIHYQQIAQRALPKQSTNLPKLASTTPQYCDICNSELDLSDDVSVNYKLCLNCYSDPFKMYNSFLDFNDFLKKLSDNSVKSINNYIFLTEIDRNFIDNLNSANEVIGNEQQFREFVLNNLKKIYIEPIIATVGYDFSLISSNLKEISAKPPTKNDLNQFQFKETKPIKAYFKCVKEISNKINCDSNLFMDYSVVNNFLKIKFNHKIHNFFLTYPLKFIDAINEVYAGLEEQDSGIDYNSTTGATVYQELVNNAASYEEEVQKIITDLNKDDFVNEFHHVKDIIDKNKDKLLNKQLSEEPEQPAESLFSEVERIPVLTEPIEKILDPAFN